MLKSKQELIKSIDDDLHALCDAPEPWRSLADRAHGDIHDLAAILSDNPEIQASVAFDLENNIKYN